MTVENQFPYQSFTANGLQTNFALGFYVDDKDHFEVKKNDLSVSINDYSYDKTSNSIVFNTPPNKDDLIQVKRVTIADRATNYATYNNSFRPEVLNKDLDKLWLKIQELGVADMLLKLYVDRLHAEQKNYIDNKEQIINHIINDLRSYVNQQDNDLNSRIESLNINVNNLRNYVDSKDLDLKIELESLINKQGVSLQQLNEYYQSLLRKMANIATEKGWFASLVIDASGKSQQEINNGLDSIADLAIIETPINGMRIYVSSVYPLRKGVEPSNCGGGYFKYSVQSDKVADGFIVVDSPKGGKWIKQYSNLTVDDFGAYGNGIDDDSDAFNAYALSPYTGINIQLGCRKAVYLIAKQVDCNNKGIIGHGFSRQNATYYNHTSITVDGTGNFTNADTKLDGKAFIQVGAEIRDLQLYGKNANSLDGLQLSSGYNFTLSNINIAGFRNQVYVLGITVSFRVSDLMSISAQNAGFYIEDSISKQSTTAYFERCSWQWGKAPIIFAKDAYGCSFRDIIIEYMETGLTAKVWSNCIFDNIWAEETKGGLASDWLINTQHQQSFSNQYSNLYIRTPWINRADPNAIAVTNAVGGITLEDSQIAASGSTGAKVVLSTLGIKTRFANWFGSSNNPKSTRRLSIASQAAAEGSNYKTPITIDAPNGCLYIRNLEDTDYTPVTLRTLIGSNADNSDALYGVDTYTQTMRRWSTKENGSNDAGNFYAPMMISYHSFVENQQTNNGWTIRRESTGIYVIERLEGNTNVLTRPHVIVSGVTVGAGVGGLTPTVNAVQWIEAYSGSWQTYGVTAGFKVIFKDLQGVAIDVQRFTVAFTSGR